MRSDDGPSCPVGGGVEPFRGGRRLHAGSPDHGAAGVIGLAHRHALIAARRHRRTEQNLDTKFFERFLRIGRKILREDRQNARAGLDEQHPGLSRIHIAEFRRQRLMGQLGDHACHFHARRACADDDEGQQRPPFFFTGGEFGALESQKQAAANCRCIFERLETGGGTFPLVAAEIGVAGAGGQHQRIETDHLTRT